MGEAAAAGGAVDHPAQRELTVVEIMRVAGVSRQTVFTCQDKVVAGGVTEQMDCKWSNARQLLVRGALAEESK